MKTKHLLLNKIGLASFFASLALLLGGGTALAAYSPGSYPGPAPAGAFPSVVTTQTFGTSGGTLTTTVDGYNLSLKIPAGAFSTATQVTVYASNPSSLSGLLPGNETFMTAFAIGWTPTSTASKPLVLTVTSANISSNTQVYFTNTSGLTLDSSAAVSSGVADISFVDDPGVVLASSTTSSSVPSNVGHLGGGAGSTGPLTSEELLLTGVLLLVLGAGLVTTMTLRKRNSVG